MSNGLSNHGSGHHSRNGKKPPAIPMDDEVDEEIFSDEDSTPEELFDDDSEVDHEPFVADELEAAVQEELAIGKRRQHPLRRIEARWEEARLNDLLREVYDDE